MSGKKGSEVASVLKMGETARKDTDKKYDIKINDLEKKTQSTYEKAQNLEHTILEKSSTDVCFAIKTGRRTVGRYKKTSYSKF